MPLVTLDSFLYVKVDEPKTSKLIVRNKRSNLGSSQLPNTQQNYYSYRIRFGQGYVMSDLYYLIPVSLWRKHEAELGQLLVATLLADTAQEADSRTYGL